MKKICVFLTVLLAFIMPVAAMADGRYWGGGKIDGVMSDFFWDIEPENWSQEDNGYTKVDLAAKTLTVNLYCNKAVNHLVPVCLDLEDAAGSSVMPTIIEKSVKVNGVSCNIAKKKAGDSHYADRPANGAWTIMLSSNALNKGKNTGPADNPSSRKNSTAIVTIDADGSNKTKDDREKYSLVFSTEIIDYSPVFELISSEAYVIDSKTTLEKGKSYNFTPFATGNKAADMQLMKNYKIAWSSSDKSVATVKATGFNVKVTALKAGEVGITSTISIKSKKYTKTLNVTVN